MRQLTAPNSPTTAKLVSLDELRVAQKKDPLVAAGWQGILFLIMVPFAFFVSIQSAATELERHPQFRPVEGRMPEKTFEAELWKA